MSHSTVLVVAAHPDDEILGCGGAMARHVQAGDQVSVAILAEGVTSRDSQRDRERRREELSTLGEAARRANGIFGVTDVEMHDFPDNRMDTVARLDIVKHIESLIERTRANILYTHHVGDVNIDHRCIHEAVVTACRPMPGNHRVDTLLFFEIASSTEWQTPGSAPPFIPNWYLDITETLQLKKQALDAYESEMHPWPHARSIEALTHLAHWRGANIGVDAAEAFMLGRRINV
jgi:LmbE family N-acetylglucosaminyl deacetylase